MRHASRRLVVASAGAVLLISAMITPAHAADPTGATADLISELAPDVGDVLVGSVTDAGVLAEVGALDVTVPLTGEDPVQLSTAGLRSGLEVALPAELDLGAGSVADDGTVVYRDGADSAAVQVLEDGSTRLQTVTASAASPREFTYDFGDVEPVLAADGSVALVQPFDGGVVHLGTVEPAWAVDAAGVDVPTHYRVEDGALVQEILPGGGTRYPVVADPTISYGWNVYVTYNRAESRTIANSPLTDKAKYVSVACVFIPNAPLAAACGVLTYDSLASIASTFRSAKAVNKCTQIGYVPIAMTFQVVSWHVVSC